MTLNSKSVWKGIGALAASGLLITVFGYATNAYVKAAVAEEMKLHPTSTGFTTVRDDVDLIQDDMLLVKDGVADNSKVLTEVAASQQRFEELFIEYLGRQ